MGGGTSRQEAYRSLTGTERLASLVQSESKSSPLVFPPLALHSALRLVRRGAGGVTRRELQAVLGVEDTGVEDTNVVGIFVRGGEASLKQSFLADHEEFRRCLLALDGEESCAAWAAKMGAKVNVSVDQRCKMVVLTAASVEVPLRQSANEKGMLWAIAELRPGQTFKCALVDIGGGRHAVFACPNPSFFGSNALPTCDEIMKAIAEEAEPAKKVKLLVREGVAEATSEWSHFFAEKGVPSLFDLSRAGADLSGMSEEDLHVHRLYSYTRLRVHGGENSTGLTEEEASNLPQLDFTTPGHVMCLCIQGRDIVVAAHF